MGKRGFVIAVLAASLSGISGGTRCHCLEAKDLVGFWTGTLTSEVLSAPVKVTLDMGLEGEDLIGIVAAPYGVARLDNLSFSEGKLSASFSHQLASAEFSGVVDEDRVFRFDWQILAGASGKGEMKWVDPRTVPAIDPASLNGVFQGKASGPLLPVDLVVTLELSTEDGEIKGRLIIPVGKFTIIEAEIRHNRVILLCRNDAGTESFVVGSYVENGLDVFLSLGIGAAEAHLEKRTVQEE